MKRAILPILFLAVTLIAQAQTKLVFEETAPEAYLIKYAQANTNSQTNINSIITLLGKADEKKGNGRPARTPEFVVRFEQQARIAKAADQLQLLVQLSKLSATADFNYRGFDVTEVLLPENLNVKIRLLDAQQKEVKEFNLQAISLSKDKVILLETSVQDTTTEQKYTLKVEPKELIYTSEDVREVQDRVDLILAYYEADQELSAALKDIQRIAPDDIDRLSQHERHLREMENWFEQLRKDRFKEKLNLTKHDPENFLSKLNKLQHLLQDRRQAINHSFATLDRQFYNRGVDMVRTGNIAGAQSYFVKSIEVNPKFAPAHLQLAQLDFRNGYLQKATDRTHNILTGMRVDQETKQRALALAHDIYSTYITAGNQHTTRGEYTHALAAFGEARDLCSTIGGLACNLPALNDGEARAATGNYRALVSEGKRYLAQNDFTKAERMAGEALQFQKEFDFVLHGAREATDLQNQVKYHYYVKHIDTGKSYLNEKNYAAALKQFEAALDLEQAYAFNRVRELGSLAQKTAKPIILQELRAGYDEARNNRLADARKTAAKMVAMQTRYGLGQDKDVLSSFSLLQERISTQECVNTQAAYDTHFQKAKELAQSKNFLAADRAYQSAIAVANGKVECQVATFTAQDGKEAIKPAVTYQQMLEDINRFVGSKKYKEAIDLYVAAERHYVSNQVNRFGLDHVSLYNFALNNKKQDFTASVVHYLADLGEEKIALDLLTSLLEDGYAKRKTKKVQEQIGKQLAQKDVRAGVNVEAKKQAVVYVKENRKLNKVESTYVKERKKLAKS